MTAAVAPPPSRVAVGTLVARATLRPPAALRAAFDTLARIAPGRIIAGLGAGDDESIAEDSAFGVLPATPPRPAGGGRPPGAYRRSTGPGGDGPEARWPGGSYPVLGRPA